MLKRASWTEKRPSSRPGGRGAGPGGHLFLSGPPVRLPLHAAQPHPGGLRPGPGKNPCCTACWVSTPEPPEHVLSAHSLAARPDVAHSERTKKGEGVTKQSLYLFNKKIISLEK